MTKRPVTTPAADPRRARIAEIDVELTRLETLRDEKSADVRADEQLHCLDQSVDLQKRLNGEIGCIDARISDLQEQRFKLELGGEQVAAPRAAQAAPTAKDWDIEDNLPPHPPAYPKGARFEGRLEELNKAFNDTVEWHVQHRCMGMMKAGVHPNTKAHFHALTVVLGQVTGIYNWLTDRCDEAEERLANVTARLDAMESHGVRYVGTWQRAQTYGKGMVVTADGSLWVALRPTAEGEQPGKVIDAWQLAAKGNRA